MFARMTQPDFGAIERQRFAVERTDQSELLRKRRRVTAFASREILRQLAGKPRPSLRAAADHHRIGAGRSKRGVGIFETIDIAVDDDRNRDSIFHCTHRCPVGSAFVELAAGAAMHGDELHARLLGAARQFRRVARRIVPAKPHFQRDRHIRRFDHGVDQGQRVIEIAHQCRSRLAAGDMPGRTAHIDVDDIGPGVLGDLRALAHPACFATGNLHDMKSRAVIFSAAARHALLRRAPAAGERRARSHFRNHQPGAEPRRLAAERRIGHAGHRRQKHRIWQRN